MEMNEPMIRYLSATDFTNGTLISKVTKVEECKIEGKSSMFDGIRITLQLENSEKRKIELATFNKNYIWLYNMRDKFVVGCTIVWAIDSKNERSIISIK